MPFMCAVGGTWSRRSHVHAGSQVSGSLESAVRDLDEINEEMGRGSGSQAVRVERAGAPAAENGWQRAFRKVEQNRLVDQNGRRPGGVVLRVTNIACESAAGLSGTQPLCWDMRNSLRQLAPPQMSFTAFSETGKHASAGDNRNNGPAGWCKSLHSQGEARARHNPVKYLGPGLLRLHNSGLAEKLHAALRCVAGADDENRCAWRSAPDPRLILSWIPSSSSSPMICW